MGKTGTKILLQFFVLKCQFFAEPKVSYFVSFSRIFSEHIAIKARNRTSLLYSVQLGD